MVGSDHLKKRINMTGQQQGNAGAGNGEGGQQQQQQQPAPSAFDPKTIGDADFAKIFDDPRTFEHPRFKELTAAQQELKALKKAQATENEKKLEAEKKHEELATLRAKERDDAIGQLNSVKTDNAIIKEAVKKGITDLDAALKLIDRSAVKMNEDGTIAGIAEALDALIKNHPLVKGAKRDIGSGSNPADGGGDLAEFTMSQIQDPIFYAKNRDAINLAMAKGRIKDDR